MSRLSLAILLLPLACEPSAPPTPAIPASAPWLEDQAHQRGVNFTWHSGAEGGYRMPEIIGGGCALFDMDGDGDLDAYLVQGSRGGNLLLENDGGHFVDTSNGSGAADTGYGMGVAVGDFDGDGDEDLYVTNVGPNLLLRNDGDGRFTDVTASAGVGDAGGGASAAFCDLDADGDLELGARNYLVWAPDLDLACYGPAGARDYCSPRNFLAPARDVVYRNDGDGSFSDMSEVSGIGGRIGTGLGVLCNDYTGDGRIDIFVANDGMADQLWRNNGDWTFTDVAPEYGCALDDEGRAKAGMGVASTDYDHDGDLDILVCNLSGESDSVFRNDGAWFTDVTAETGIRAATRHATRFGLGWVDLDNDGHLDLYEANGRVQRLGEAEVDDPYAEANHLLIGDGGTWRPHPLAGGTLARSVHTSRGAAFGDVDGDGGVDVLVVNRDAPAYLLMNVVPRRGNWLALDVREASGRVALGAVVTLSVGNHTMAIPVAAAWSYLASNDATIHVGLGTAEAATDIRVRWADGAIEALGTRTAGATHVLQRSLASP